MKFLADYREKFFEDWYQFNSTLFFITICLLYIIILVLKRLFVIADIAAFEVLQAQGQMWIFDIFFGLQYLSIPFFLAWKFTLTTFLLWVGCFMFGYRLTYATLWRWVMFSELIFIIPEILDLFWFLSFAGDPSYQDVVAFYPFSLMNLVDYQSLPDKLHYPFKALNVFEIGYWLVLIIGIFYLSRKKWSISSYVVITTYIPFFLLWLVFYTLIYK